MATDVAALLQHFHLPTLQAIAYALGSTAPLETAADLQPVLQTHVADEMLDELLGTVNQDHSRKKRIEQWLATTTHNLPYLLPKPSKGIGYLKQYFENVDRTSTEQAFWYSWLLAHVGQQDFADMDPNSHSFDFPDDHGLHHAHRQEMWNLCGALYNQTLGDVYLACRVWRRQETPYRENHLESTMLKMDMLLLFQDGRQYRLHPVTLPVTMPPVHLQNSPFRIQIGHQRFDSTYESSLFPMNVEWVEPEHQIELRLLLDERKPLWTWAHASHGVGVRKYAFPFLRAEGTLLLNTQSYTVEGTCQYHHLWEAGIFPGTYPRGFLMHALRVLQGSKSRDNHYPFPLQFFCFVNDTVQVYGYCLEPPTTPEAYKARAGKKGIKIDLFTVHMEDGEFREYQKKAWLQLLEWGPVDHSQEVYPHQVVLNLPALHMRLQWSRQQFVRQNLMYLSEAHWDDVWMVGELTGTWKNKNVYNSQGLMNFGTHQTTKERVQQIMNLLELSPDLAVAKGRRPPSEATLLKSLEPSGPSGSQTTVCVLFWLVPFVLLALVIFMIVILFRTSGVMQKKQFV